jgi:hypothetical protein
MAAWKKPPNARVQRLPLVKMCGGSGDMSCQVSSTLYLMGGRAPLAGAIVSSVVSLLRLE